MLRGTIDKIGGSRVPFEFIDRGELRPGVYASSFRIDKGPIVESEVGFGFFESDSRRAQAFRLQNDNEAIRKAGGIPDSIEFD